VAKEPDVEFVARLRKGGVVEVVRV